MNKHGRFGMIVCVLAMCALATGIQAATFNVATPTEFQAALTTAQANGSDDTINVAAGTYSISSTLTFSSSENNSLVIAGAGSSTTILNGGGARQCLSLTSNGNGGISVAGLTCRNGRATTLGGGLAINCSGSGAISLSNCEIRNNISERSAGGAYLGGMNGSIVVESCTVDGNTLDPVTGDDGGGIDIYIDTNGTGNITLRNSTITNNTIGECPSAVGSPDGAGVFMYHLGAGSTITVADNTISNNTALGGPGGFYLRVPVSTTLLFSGNTIADNSSGRATVGVQGGGSQIHLEDANVTVSNNKFMRNKALGPYAEGGGMFMSITTRGTCDVINNVYANNSSALHGGGATITLGNGMTRANVAGNLFVSNAAAGAGGGVIVNSECSVSQINNTFFSNTANEGGGSSFYAESASRSLSVRNDIFRGNTPNALANLGTGPMNAQHCNIEGGAGQSWFGTGCIDSDPLFFNSSNPPGADGLYATLDDGLHLTASSPSANTGNAAAVPSALTADIAGQPRAQGGAVDMGAYEGVAGTPASYSLTMAVSPAGSGSTTPTVGTQSLGSPQSITATPASGYSFVNWTSTSAATVAAAASASTTVSFTADATVTANFAAISMTATLTMAVSPAAGGTTSPAIGAGTVNTQAAIPIAATASSGYSFVNWTASGNAAVAGSTSASTTATLTGDSTITANFKAAAVSGNLMFIHHSSGQNWLDNSLRAALDAKSYVDKVNEITYGTTLAQDAGRPASLGSIPGDNTDMYQWILWFNDYLKGIQSHGGGINKIVMFKSCYPNSDITSAGTEPGDPFNSDRAIANYMAIYRHPDGPGRSYTRDGHAYLPLEDVFAANPGTLFIPVTAPALVPSQTSKAAAANARKFNNWLTSTWLPAYKARTGLNNVVVYDWFNFLANPDDGSSHANMQKDAYQSSDPSHPNDTANAASTVEFATASPNFIDAAWNAFSSSATSYNLTMAVSPAAAGATTPAVGTRNVTSPQSITATPASGYSFVNWTSTASASVASAASASTTVSFTADSTVTANFAAISTTATLTMAVSPAFGGTTSPAIGAGTVNTQVAIPIAATASFGYSFVNWTASGNAAVASSTSASTTATLTGDSTVTANFSSAPCVPQMTCGSTIVIAVGDLMDFHGAAFGAKPTPSASYADPVSGRAKTAALKATFYKDQPDRFTAEWTSKVALFNKKSISAGTDTWTYLQENPIADLTCDLQVKAVDENKEKGTYSAGQIVVPPPQITSIQNSAGETITAASPGSTVHIIGSYFGTTAPSAWFEYDSKGKIKQAKCKTLKNLFTHTDAKGKLVCMDPETGASDLPVQLPSTLPAGIRNFIVIDNGLGRCVLDFTLE